MTQPTAEQFLMGGAASAKFETIGTTIEGTITTPPEVTQQTDFKTGKPKFWDDGRPRNQLVVTLQTTLRENNDDDGLRRLYVKGDMAKAIREAVKQAGARGLEVGGTLRVRYTGDGQIQDRGDNPPKLYAAQYVRATSSPSADAFLNQEVSALAPPVQGDPWERIPQAQPTPQPQPAQAQRPW